MSDMTDEPRDILPVMGDGDKNLRTALDATRSYALWAHVELANLRAEVARLTGERDRWKRKAANAAETAIEVTAENVRLTAQVEHLIEEASYAGLHTPRFCDKCNPKEAE